jgi:magnesium transporter
MQREEHSQGTYMPFRAYYLDEKKGLQQDLSLADVRAALLSGTGLLWVDFSETTKEDGKILEDVFGFHRLAVEDCLETEIHPPKIDDYGSHIFALFHGINHVAESDIVETAELALFIGATFVVSNHNFRLYSVEEVRYQVETDARIMQRGSAFLAHTLIDALVDNIRPTVDRMSDIAALVEEDALKEPRQSTLEAILRLKRSVRRVHRTIVPERDLLNRLSRGEYNIIGTDARVYFRDVYDHVVRIEDLNMSVRDSADNALSTYLTAIANRQNETMKVLAVAGAIFLPLTLLAGIYGMNFDNMPELHWKWGYFGVLVVMGTVVAGALATFWRRGWFKFNARGMKIRHSFAVDRTLLRGHRETKS